MHCAGIEPATFCVVGEYSHHYAISVVKDISLRFEFEFVLQQEVKQ
jgi:hypothetical protein